MVWGNPKIKLCSLLTQYFIYFLIYLTIQIEPHTFLLSNLVCPSIALFLSSLTQTFTIFLFIDVQGAVGLGLLVRHLLAPRRTDLDHVVNPEDRDGRLGGELEGLYLGDYGLEDTGLLVVPHQAEVLQLLVLLEIKN